MLIENSVVIEVLHAKETKREDILLFHIRIHRGKEVKRSYVTDMLRQALMNWEAANEPPENRTKF